MMIYYAYTTESTDTITDSRDLGIISKAFPLDEIMCPVVTLRDNCRKLVRESDILVFSTRGGTVSRTVFEDVTLAQSERKPVFLIDRRNHTLILWSGSFLIVDRSDWKLNYARPVSA